MRRPIDIPREQLYALARHTRERESRKIRDVAAAADAAAGCTRKLLPVAPVEDASKREGKRRSVCRRRTREHNISEIREIRGGCIKTLAAGFAACTCFLIICE